MSDENSVRDTSDDQHAIEGCRHEPSCSTFDYCYEQRERTSAGRGKEALDALEEVICVCAPDRDGVYDRERQLWQVEELARSVISGRPVLPYPGPRSADACPAMFCEEDESLSRCSLPAGHQGEHESETITASPAVIPAPRPASAPSGPEAQPNPRNFVEYRMATFEKALVERKLRPLEHSRICREVEEMAQSVWNMAYQAGRRDGLDAAADKAAELASIVRGL